MADINADTPVIKRLGTGGTGEIIEKKSRFIGVAEPVATAEEALSFVNEIKKRHYQARHNCYAYSVGLTEPALRYSDDGEPQGTAGKPILGVIEGSGVRNIVIVVTRYFGGVLLGTGGLVRAYTDAAKAALDAAEIALVQPLLVARLTFAYKDVDKVTRCLEEAGISNPETEFMENVSYTVRIPEGLTGKLFTDLRNITGGRMDIKEMEHIIG
ncbi:MAG: YigZ family protein [Eubacterium sp.]|nr:YigZ family protein [Eubacterium sp.]